MATGIEWTEETWNPIVGCSLASPGCTNCYAMKWAHSGMKPVKHYAGTTKQVNGKAVWTGKVAAAPDHIWLAPLKRKKPTTWFVNSMGDMFHEDVPDEWIDRAFAVMALCPQHTFQVLTKRSKRMREYVSKLHDEPVQETVKRIVAAWPKATMPIGSGIQIPLPNVWLGISCEDQARADERIPDLLATPAAIRFVSAEPLLGPIGFKRIPVPPSFGKEPGWQDVLEGWRDNCADYGGREARLDWIIVGGESGAGARPMHPDWARSIRDQCAAARVPFFFKQWGEWVPVDIEPEDGWQPMDGRPAGTFEGVKVPLRAFDEQAFARVGKKRAGRPLDGVQHDAMPERQK